VVVREQVWETQAAVGRRPRDVPGYTFRVWVTNRSESALELWRDYNGRACVERRNLWLPINQVLANPRRTLTLRVDEPFAQAFSHRRPG
jgi:hypothetical protein